MSKYYIYIQGVKTIPLCVVCGVELTNKQVKDWEINQFTYTCGEEHYEESL